MKKDTQKIIKLTTTAMLTAIIAVMAFTPLGYLKTAGLEITFIMVPVVVGAVLGGRTVGAFLGLVFGITSFIQCFGISPFGVALLGINPVFTFIVCIVPRVLAGYLTALVYSLITSKNTKRQKLATPIASLLGPLFNTVLFMSALIAFFGRTEFIQNMSAGKNMLAFAAAFVGVQGLVEAGVCFVISTAVCAAVGASLSKRKAKAKN